MCKLFINMGHTVLLNHMSAKVHNSYVKHDNLPSNAFFLLNCCKFALQFCKKKIKNIIIKYYSQNFCECVHIKNLIFKDRWGEGKFHIINTNTNTYVVILGL